MTCNLLLDFVLHALFWEDNMAQILRASEDTDLLDVMDSLEELCNHDRDQKIRF